MLPWLCIFIHVCVFAGSRFDASVLVERVLYLCLRGVYVCVFVWLCPFLVFRCQDFSALSASCLLFMQRWTHAHNHAPGVELIAWQSNVEYIRRWKQFGVPEWREHHSLILLTDIDFKKVLKQVFHNYDNTVEGIVLCDYRGDSTPITYLLHSQLHCPPAPLFTKSVATTIPAPTKNPKAPYLFICTFDPQTATVASVEANRPCRCKTPSFFFPLRGVWRAGFLRVVLSLSHWKTLAALCLANRNSPIDQTTTNGTPCIRNIYAQSFQRLNMACVIGLAAQEKRRWWERRKSLLVILYWSGTVQRYLLAATVFTKSSPAELAIVSDKLETIVIPGHIRIWIYVQW